MTNLIKTAYYTRKIIRYTAISLVVLLIAKIIISTGINIYKKLYPPPPPPPSVGFGKLPPLDFPQKVQPKLKFVLETVTNSLPTFYNQANVYFMPVSRPNLLALDRATKQAARVGFVFEPVDRNGRIFEYNKSDPLPSRLDMDIISGRFKLHVAWFDNQNFLNQKFLPNEQQAIAEAKGFLRNANLLPEDLTNGEVLVTPLKALGIEMIQAVSISEADFIQVDFFRQSLTDKNGLVLPNITSEKNEGVIRVIISGSRTQGERIIYTKYDYYPIDIENFETYPLKPIQTAWEELINGNGYITSYSLEKNTATIRSISLGYYDSFSPQNYFQPVYIFSGDDNFLAIVSAIDPSWINQ